MGVRLGDQWMLTTEHPASSYGQPVLIDEDGEPVGPGDMVSGGSGVVMLAADLVSRLAQHADLDADGRAMVARFCGLLEQ